MKKDKLRKLELELTDLKTYQSHGLVCTRDLTKHEEEICLKETEIETEKRRLALVKESGEATEYETPRKPTPQAVYAETPTMSDLETTNDSACLTENSFETEAETADVTEAETTIVNESASEGDDGETKDENEDDEGYKWQRVHAYEYYDEDA